MIKIKRLYKKFRIPINDIEIIKKLFFLYDYKTLNLLNNEFYSLKDINFEVKTGEKVFVLGSSGSGKTTLFSILSNKINHDEGSIEKSNNFFSSTLINMPPNLFPRLKLENFIKILLSFYIVEKKIDCKKFIINSLNIDKAYLNTNFYEMDKSLFKSIIFSISCMTNYKIYLFDNFNFDFTNDIFINLWKKFKLITKDKTCLFFSCNNFNFIKENADKVLILENSQIKKFDLIRNFTDEELTSNMKKNNDQDYIEEDEM